ncbi:hypothetical protein ANTQUA_LOCUS4217 [Anthophora quadrimaculata]
MEELSKRKKITKESTIVDIASTISEISESLTSISESYSSLLKVNKALVLYIQSSKKQQDVDIDELQNNLNQTRIEEESE